MTIKAKQESHPESSRRWSWKIWLEGSNAELDRIESVVYQLHSSFRDPVRTVTDRAAKFLLSSSAWGEFMIYLTVNYKDGNSMNLQHWLRLHVGAPTKEVPGATMTLKPPEVFISSGMADSEFSSKIKEALRHRGVRVVSQDDLPSGSPLQSTLHAMIEKADIGLAVISGDSSPWVQSEIAEMRDQRKPIIPLLLSSGEFHELPRSIENLKAIRIDQTSDPEQVADQIFDAVSALKKYV
jgi:hypothetical protein